MAKADKYDLVVIWLDLANAYGAVPHRLIHFSVEFFHVPEKLRGPWQHIIHVSR